MADSMNRDRHISQAGLDLIKGFEGLMLTAYKDSVGIPSIGYGHTRNVKMGDSITRERAEELLLEDIEPVEECIKSEVTERRLTQHQWDALVAFTFNVGCMAFRNSKLLGYVRMGDFPSAANEFSHWTRAGTEHPLGLIKRRAAEASWFLTQDSVTS